MKRTIRSRLAALAGATLLALGAAAPAAAAAGELPGKGVRVQPVKSSLPEEAFQTLLVMRALEKLGYEVQPMKDLEPVTAHVAVANGDATFMANHWNPLHADFYRNAGAETKLVRRGVYTDGAAQGYLIDRKTAQQHGIANVGQLKDPKIAALFDTDGDGKADLTGCNPGWGCEAAIERHLDAFGLRATVTHRQGSYAALMADTITRFRQGKPILYYTWTPYWASAVLRPGQDVVWLESPAQPGSTTRLANGKDYGFQVNQQQIVANKAFADANPAAARLFELMKLPVADINAQNLRMSRGENKAADIERHADGWIRAHQQTFDDWVAQAQRAAAN